MRTARFALWSVLAAVILGSLVGACRSGQRAEGPPEGAVWVYIVNGGAAAPVAVTPAPRAQVAPEPPPAPPAPPAPVCRDGKCFVPKPAFDFESGPHGDIGLEGVSAPAPLPFVLATADAAPVPAPAGSGYLGFLVIALLLLTGVLSLHGKRRLAVVPVAALVVLACAGCRVGAAIGDSLPPSEGYVDELHAAQDKAIADLRTHVDTSDAKVRADLEAADRAGKEAFDKALAEGKGMPEALAAQFLAKINAASDAAKEAKDAAAGASKAATDGAADAVAKAREAAQDESRGGTPWWASLLGLVGGGGTLAVFLRRMLAAYDAQPFIDSNGRPVAEARLADMANKPA